MLKKVGLGFIALIIGSWAYTKAHNHFATAHFKARCARDGGEFIYKTVEGVEGFLLMRLRDPRDLPSRLRKRDIPEDPYGHTNFESQMAEYLFVSPPQRLYEYLETPWRGFRYLQEPFKKIDMDVPKAPFLRFSGYRQHDPENAIAMKVEGIGTPKSRYGVTWRGFRTKRDQFFGVWGGEVLVKDLESDEVLAIRRGYFFYPWSSHFTEVCPADRTGSIAYRFVSGVLMPFTDEGGVEQ